MSAVTGPLRQLLATAPDARLLADGDCALSVRDVAQAVAGLAQALRTHDMPVSCIASQLDNGIDALLIDFAARTAGAVQVALPPFFSAAQTAHVLAECAPTWLALPSTAASPGPGWEALRGPSPLERTRLWRRDGTSRAATPWPAGTACITYTSGSTGRPKGVCLDEPTLSAVADSLAGAYAELDLHRHLCALPLATLLETVGVYAALRRGAEIRVPSLATLGYSGASGLQPEYLHTALQRHRPHSMILVPQLLAGLLDALDRHGPLDAAPRLLAVGGAKVGTALLQRADAHGLPVYEGYGLSEAGSVVCLNRPGAQRAGAVGRPLPHVAVSIAADGEVLLHGPGFLGYLGEPPRTPSQPLATGDLGTLDADGYLHLHGRKRNVFITAYGRNVSPEWIEAELVSLPAIAQAVVCGEARAWNLALIVAAGADVDDAALQAALDTVNRGLPDYARLGGFLRVAPFGVDDGLLTPNGRVRRDAVLARDAAAIDACYHAASFPSSALELIA